jgi:hypothetical protein
MNENNVNPLDFKTLYPDTTGPDATLAAVFLHDMADGGLVTVAAIPVNPNAKPRTCIYGSDGVALINFLVDQQSLPHNVFFAPNMAVGRGVPSNADIIQVRAIILDFDPARDKPLEDERMRLREVAYGLIHGRVPPTFVIDSGGGMQVIWQLDEPIDVTSDNREIVIETVEMLMRDLSHALGAETHTCTVKNLFRVPFTKNWPMERRRTARLAGGPALALCDPCRAAVRDDNRFR